MAITIVKLQNDNVEIIRSAKKKRSLQAVAAVYIEDERVFITDCCNLSDDFNAVEVTSVTRKDGTVVPIGGDSELLYNELKEYFFFNIIGSSITNYVGEFNNYTDLTTSVPAGTAGRFAFVLNSQGTKWLPGSLGGTFYGAGWYYDTGSQWVSKNDEIYEELQAKQKQGFIDYNDATGDINLVADTWTTIPNDGQGAYSNNTYKPIGVTELMDVSTGAIDTSELSLGDSILVRNDFTITPSTNNAKLEFRYSLGTGGGSYTLEKSLSRLDDGSGIPYRFSLKPDLIYMGDSNTKDNPIVLQVKLSTDGVLSNAGTVVQLIKGNF